MKLAIISHTEHYKTPDGTIVGWGPTISEINHLARDFEEIYHVAMLHPGTPPPSALCYTSPNIHFVPLAPSGGKSVTAKLKILTSIPNVLKAVRQTLEKVDVFQLRTPTGMGVFLIPYLTLFIKKKGWYKYAGNWNQENPPFGYWLQREMLKKQNRTVTINGKWPDQPEHCLTFENPCLTLGERKEGADVIKDKSYRQPFSFCFVGRLEDPKGVQRILDAFAGLGDTAAIKEIHFVGSGAKFEVYKRFAEQHALPAIFHGFLDRERVFELYRRSHFFLLPSTASEGFPKVIAEAMNFGCIPMVSDVSSIGQYINRENGFMVSPCTAGELRTILKGLRNYSGEDLIKKVIKGYAIAESFTFENYKSRIKKEILS